MNRCGVRSDNSRPFRSPPKVINTLLQQLPANNAAKMLLMKSWGTFQRRSISAGDSAAIPRSVDLGPARSNG